MKLILSLALFAASAAHACPKPWVCSVNEMTIPVTKMAGLSHDVTAKIRSGYYPEQAPFRGNILYFEGLGDSMLNHDPLFSKLSRAGYRVIAFDYMGQGGSTGSMNDTRIKVIPQIGKLIYQKWANRTKKPLTLMGWSTGGLAAYLATQEYKVDKVVLIAPGIVANAVVGEGLSQWPVNKITMRTLTTDSYSSVNPDPHRDPIRPESPTQVMSFATDLLTKACESQSMPMSLSVKGLVLLSGAQDNYVNASKTLGIIRRNARHFHTRVYPGALHEIDNERKEIREKAHSDILNFLENRL